MVYVPEQTRPAEMELPLQFLDLLLTSYPEYCLLLLVVSLKPKLDTILNSGKSYNFRAVVVAQLKARLLLIPVVRGSNTVIGKYFVYCQLY